MTILRKENGTMKNKRFARLISLLLSCLLIMGALSGAVAYAEEEGTAPEVGEEITPPTVSIKYKNVAYEDAIKLVYYVESANLAEGQSVKLILSDTPITEVKIDENTVLTSAAGKLNVGMGEEAVAYDAFLSEDIIPAELRLDTYAVAVVVDGENNLIAQSEVLEYSIFDYCMDRMEKGSTALQTELYTALLDFGASVQEVLVADDPDLTIDMLGGWANEYYGVKIDSVIGGEVVESKKYYYNHYDIGTDKTVAINKLIVEDDIASKFIEANASAQDKGMTVTAGNGDVTFGVRAKPGFSVINCSYERGIGYSGFDGEALPAFLSATRFADKAEEQISETIVTEGDATFLRVEKHLVGPSNDFRICLDAVKKDGATKYVVEYDYRWNGAASLGEKGNGVILLKFNNSAGTYLSKSFSPTSNVNSDLKYGAETIKLGEWTSIKVEFNMVEEGKWDVITYVDGKVTNTQTGLSSTGVPQIRYETRGYTQYDMSMDFDNFYVSAK